MQSQRKNFIMVDQINCPSCQELINASAIKCKHCLEFLPGSEKKQKNNKISPELIQALIDLLSKALTPVTIIILALAFRPTVAMLLSNTEEAEFLGTKIQFTASYSFTGELTPVEIYYLLGAANNSATEASSLNYDGVKEKGLDNYIFALEEKGLAQIKIKANPEEDQAVFGEEALIILPTEKGKRFLVELGLQLSDEAFVDAP